MNNVCKQGEIDHVDLSGKTGKFQGEYTESPSLDVMSLSEYYDYLIDPNAELSPHNGFKTGNRRKVRRTAKRLPILIDLGDEIIMAHIVDISMVAIKIDVGIPARYMGKKLGIAIKTSKYTSS